MCARSPTRNTSTKDSRGICPRSGCGRRALCARLRFRPGVAAAARPPSVAPRRAASLSAGRWCWAPLPGGSSFLRAFHNEESVVMAPVNERPRLASRTVFCKEENVDLLVWPLGPVDLVLEHRKSGHNNRFGRRVGPHGRSNATFFYRCSRWAVRVFPRWTYRRPVRRLGATPPVAFSGEVRHPRSDL